MMTTTTTEHVQQQPQQHDEQQPSPTNCPPIGLCSVCAAVTAKYKCPACSTLTCSLVCCTSHKLKTSCSGKRDRTKFVSSQNMSAKDVCNDFHFLEDVLQSKDRAKRTFRESSGGGVQDNTRTNNKNKRNKKTLDDGAFCSPTDDGASRSSSNAGVSAPRASDALVAVQDLSAYNKGAKKLVATAKLRGTTLVLMPLGMSKRTQNTSSVTNQQPKKQSVLVAQGAQSAQSAQSAQQQHQSSSSLVAQPHSFLENSNNSNKNNISSSNSNNPRILWKVQLVFIMNSKFIITDLFRPSLATNGVADQVSVVNNSVVGFTLDGVCENTTIDEIFAMATAEGPENAIRRHTLRSLRRRKDRIQCAIQYLPSSTSNPLFAQTLGQSTLKEVLSDRVVIEYPTLFFYCPEDVLVPSNTTTTTITTTPLSTEEQQQQEENQEEIKRARIGGAVPHSRLRMHISMCDEDTAVAISRSNNDNNTTHSEELLLLGKEDEEEEEEEGTVDTKATLQKRAVHFKEEGEQRKEENADEEGINDDDNEAREGASTSSNDDDVASILDDDDDEEEEEENEGEGEEDDDDIDAEDDEGPISIDPNAIITAATIDHHAAVMSSSSSLVSPHDYVPVQNCSSYSSSSNNASSSVISMRGSMYALVSPHEMERHKDGGLVSIQHPRLQQQQQQLETPHDTSLVNVELVDDRTSTKTFTAHHSPQQSSALISLSGYNSD